MCFRVCPRFGVATCGLTVGVALSFLSFLQGAGRRSAAHYNLDQLEALWLQKEESEAARPYLGGTLGLALPPRDLRHHAAFNRTQAALDLEADVGWMTFA